MAAKLDFLAMSDLVDKAHAAGMDAGVACNPVPMYVVARSNPLDDSSPVKKAYAPVMDGVCGFAGVVIKPANCALAKHLRFIGKARANYGGGVYVNCSFFNQSLDRKEAYCNAYAKVLTDAGFDKIYVDSRMD